jgi:DNA-binding GntR family transcriptional regulator
MARTERVDRKRRDEVLLEQQHRLRELLAETIDRQPLGDAVYSTLCTAVITNVLPQGTRLSGVSLADILGVSRTPVRDALRRLESEGLVSSAGSGSIVIPLSIEDIDEIYTLRVALEGCAASLAARHRSRADLSLLDTVHQAFIDAVRDGDPDQISHLNSRFHDAMIQAAKSKRLAQIVVLLQQSVRRLGSTTLTSSKRAQQSVEEHTALLAAIRDEDNAAAEAIARQHMEEARIERLEQYHLAFMLPQASSVPLNPRPVLPPERAGDLPKNISTN